MSTTTTACHHAQPAACIGVLILPLQEMVAGCCPHQLTEKGLLYRQHQHIAGGVCCEHELSNA